MFDESGVVREVGEAEESEEKVDCEVEEEWKEVAHVWVTDAVVYPWTVMVHLEYTFSAHRTMVSTRRLHD